MINEISIYQLITLVRPQRYVQRVESLAVAQQYIGQDQQH